ncbi:MAG: HAD family hydrolase [Phycisphaerales bacterium]|nr:HAD family hydrolase [Phycisphaerales bacterium]
MSDLQGIFLDFYGTLVGGDREAVEAVCQAVIDDHKLKASATEIAVDWGLKYFQAIESQNGDSFRTLLQIEYDTLIDTIFPLTGRVEVGSYIRVLNEYLARPVLFEEVTEVLARLNIPVCIVSNADERELRLALDHLGLHFDRVVTSERAKCYKPNTGIFEYALELTGWAADRVVHVGDSLHSDVDGARRAGLRAAWVNRGDRISDIGNAVPDYTWSDLRPMTKLMLD